jgi:hypothetical protein
MSAGNLLTANGARGQRFVVAAVEGTEGTDATPTASDLQDVSECEILPVGAHVPFEPVTGYRAQSRGVVVSQHGTIRVKRALRVRDIDAADGTDAPNFALQLRHSGATEVRDATNDAYAWFFGSGQGETATYKEHHNTANNGDSVTTALLAVRTGFKLTVAAGGVWEGESQGMGVLASISAPRAPGSGAFDGSSWSDPFDAPIAVKGTTVRLYDIANAAVLTGGTLGSPGSTPAVISVEFDDETTVDVRESAQAAGGVAGFVRNPGAGKITIKMERDDYDGFNPHAAFADGRAIEVYLSKASANANVAFVGYGYIAEAPADLEISGGRYITTLVLRGLSPPDVTDNAPAAGQSPAAIINTATNRGAPLAVTGAVAAPFAIYAWST